MNNEFKDILVRIHEKPKWWDEMGVPRYCEFHPSETANIYADETMLMLIQCQDCKKRYKVCSTSRGGLYKKYLGQDGHNKIWEPWHYGDPPNNCGDDCIGGATMNVELIRILEYWVRNEETEYNWERVYDLGRYGEGYCVIYDAKYNTETGEWLEDRCEGKECYFCVDRPEKHQDTCECL